MELLRRLPQHLARTAVIYGEKRFSYETLLASSEQYSAELTKQLAPQRLSSEHPPRIGLYASPGPEYVAATWAIWQSGGICVPLATSHPPKELAYFFQHAGLSAVLTPPEHAAKLQRVAYEAGSALQLLPPPMGEDVSDYPRSWEDNGGWRDDRSSRAGGPSGAGDSGTASSSSSSSSSGGRHSNDGALIIYTSGTTGRPKGVVHTVGSLQAQIESLVTAWEWRKDDRILHTLPLHHIHGVVNALYCAHHCGAAVHFLPKFSPSAVWRNLRAGHTSVLMAVPTMYNYLLAHYDAMESEDQRESARRGAEALRLTVSGSAACPLSIISRWQKLTGQILLERYGMTETGMILSNPYRGERRPGTVGVPLPGVQVKIADDGEVRVKSTSMFKEYWNSPHATTLAFDDDGWFHTGDTGGLFVPRSPTAHRQGSAPPAARVATGHEGGISSARRDEESEHDGMEGTAPGPEPYYAILGRTSVDIIKSGGYKISALDIENVLLDHHGVREVAVVGMPDETLGEVIWAILVAKPGASEPGASDLRDLCKDRLAPYQMPRMYRFVDELPRNAMGKLNKKELVKQLHDDM